MAFMTFHSVGNAIIPTDELIFFRGVGLNHQLDILLSMMNHFHDESFPNTLMAFIINFQDDMTEIGERPWSCLGPVHPCRKFDGDGCGKALLLGSRRIQMW